jgi:hypothetical protein
VSGTVSFRLTGSAYRVIADGNWPNDHPRGWAAITASPRRRVGKGRQLLVTMPRDAALDLLAWLASFVELRVDMTPEERGDSDHRHARKAMSAIEGSVAAIGD